MLFYFSGTGNTRWAARQIAERTGENCLFIPEVMKRECRFTLKEGERLGFVFPVHGWRPPLLVRKFISQLQLTMEGHHYCYALVTAGDTIAETIKILQDDLQARGWTLNAAFSLIMPESYVGLPFMDVDSKEKETAKIEKAREQLVTFANAIAERKEDEWHLMKGPIPKFFSGPVGGFFVRHLVKDKPFRVVESRCIKCGKCAKVCPVGNINCGEGKVPVWLHNGLCLTCFSCYHHCPCHAIEFGNRTKKKGQYWMGMNQKQ